MLRLPGVAADGRVLHTGTPDGSGSGLDLLRQFALAKQQQARVEFGASRCRCNRTPHVGRQSSTPAIVGCRAALRSPWEKQAVQLTVRSIGPLPRPRSAPHPSNVCPPPPLATRQIQSRQTRHRPWAALFYGHPMSRRPNRCVFSTLLLPARMKTRAR